MRLHQINLAARTLSWRRRFDDSLATTKVSRDAARRLGDRGNEATALTFLGVAATTGAPVRRRDHRPPGCRRDLPGDRRPARRGQCDEQSSAPRCGTYAGSTKRSPRTRTRPRSKGRPATGAAKSMAVDKLGSSAAGNGPGRGGDHRTPGRGRDLPGELGDRHGKGQRVEPPRPRVAGGGPGGGRRSPHTRTRPRSSRRPATGIAKASR